MTQRERPPMQGPSRMGCLLALLLVIVIIVCHLAGCPLEDAF